MTKQIAALALALSVGACATVTRGVEEDVAFQSVPAGAEVRTSTGLGCPATPRTLKMPRKDQFIATFSKPGHATVDVPVATKLVGEGGVALVGNALIGGIIGVAVDATTGSSQNHDPNPVVAELAPLGGTRASGRRPRHRRAAGTGPS